MNSSLDTSEREADAYTPPPRSTIPLHDPDAILHHIEREVGYDHLHWDQADPHELIRAVLKYAGGHPEPQKVPLELVRFGGRCEKHLAVKPCEQCAAEMTGKPMPQAAPGESIRSETPQVKQEPFAYFVWEPSRGKFSQVMPGAAGQPGVIAAYANPPSSTAFGVRA